MVSIVCVYNNRQILEDYLLRGLQNQTTEFELILVDNMSNQFTSAANALNYGGRCATSKYIMFIHQDVYLPSGRWLEEAEGYLESLSNLGIAGVAGMVEDGRYNHERGRNIIKHGDPLEDWSWGHPIVKPVPVQTLDECLVLIPKNIFERSPFDETTCDGWDLYAVDYCLSAKRNGLGVYVLPMMVHHGSKGRVTESYFKTLEKILKKHKGHYDRINTTIDSWSTFYSLSTQRMLKRMRSRMRNNIWRARVMASSLSKGRH